MQVIEEVVIDRAFESDVDSIMAILKANYEDSSVTQRPEYEVKQYIKSFMIAKNRQGQVIGCAAVHPNSMEYAEVFSVAVLPFAQGNGFGRYLVLVCHKYAVIQGAKFVWGTTYKPDYFSGFGYKPIRVWELPKSVILAKLIQIMRRPPHYWLAAFQNRGTVMRLEL